MRPTTMAATDVGQIIFIINNRARARVLPVLAPHYLQEIDTISLDISVCAVVPARVSRLKIFGRFCGNTVPTHGRPVCLALDPLVVIERFTCAAPALSLTPRRDFQFARDVERVKIVFLRGA